MRSLEDRQITDAYRDMKRRELRELKLARPEREKATDKLSGAHGEGTERRAIPYAWKARIWAHQDFRCAKCKARLPTPSDAEYDHILPLALKGEHAERNIEALCPRPCHLEKTKADVKRISKAKRQSRLLQPREPSKRPFGQRRFQKRKPSESSPPTIRDGG